MDFVHFVRKWTDIFYLIRARLPLLWVFLDVENSLPTSVHFTQYNYHHTFGCFKGSTTYTLRGHHFLPYIICSTIIIMNFCFKEESPIYTSRDHHFLLYIVPSTIIIMNFRFKESPIYKSRDHHFLPRKNVQIPYRFLYSL